MRQTEVNKLLLCLITKNRKNKIQCNLQPQIFIINEHIWILSIMLQLNGMKFLKMSNKQFQGSL